MKHLQQLLAALEAIPGCRTVEVSRTLSAGHSLPLTQYLASSVLPKASQCQSHEAPAAAAGAV